MLGKDNLLMLPGTRVAANISELTLEGDATDVYALDDSFKVVIGHLKNLHKATTDEGVKVTFQDRTWVVVGRDTEFVLADKTLKPAANLSSVDTVWSDKGGSKVVDVSPAGQVDLYTGDGSEVVLIRGYQPCRQSIAVKLVKEVKLKPASITGLTWQILVFGPHADNFHLPHF